MKLAYSTGNPIVDEVSEMNITGNIIPATWYHTMCGENGKPKLLAINLLSDILYWYRPKEIRDEDTGNLLGFQKRFKADLLQRSYRQIENQFGVSQKQARNALDYLCDIGVVRKHLRNEKTKEGMPIHNNMYLELVSQKVPQVQRILQRLPQEITTILSMGKIVRWKTFISMNISLKTK